jgi:hypothetical protein
MNFVGAASSRELKRSRLEAAPTGVYFSYLGLADKRISEFKVEVISDDSRDAIFCHTREGGYPKSIT